MSRIRYTAEFKAEAIKQITERGHAVAEVATRLGISGKSLYVWLKQSQQLAKVPVKDEVLALKSEVSRMKAELKRTTEERDILKKAAAYFARVSE
ncbi:MAG: transposase [Gallionella sp.]|nr:transposase [Gallionella sp.]NNM80734.1 transposase [Gallionella sp.]